MKWIVDEFIKDWPWILGITIVVATWLTFLDIRGRKKLVDKIVKKIQKDIKNENRR